MSKDTIYREDAIKAYNEAMEELVKWQMEEWQLGDFSECEFNTTDCKHIARKIEAIPSADRPQGWIPCSERLPEKKAQKYLIYYQDYLNGGFDYAVVPYLRTPYGWEFEFYNESNNCETLAWMPLPEPWKGADDEDA